MTTLQDTIPFDAADYLTTPEAQAEFISIAIESGDRTELIEAFEIVARARARSGLANASAESMNEVAATEVPVLTALGRALDAIDMRLEVRPKDDRDHPGRNGQAGAGQAAAS